ncbi:hypothetical protein [Pseudomonas mucidolens]|uniref:Exo-alpha-sialidase n=1 Tax=Pseudomonas mucidolens TaxID=46679 RepID=A0A1H2P1Y9_9PSED|nr:hypothetical protein [Pseudomonas mucidolens]SDV11664.1 hypothetical protein SAMN05216202_5321 [Pseudomonas mucidolens]SQH36546.1 Uncharacterised protein [Pseudomonas mucidolens]
MFDLPEPEKSELSEELQKTELNWPFIDYVRDGAVASPVAAVEFNGKLEILYLRQTENGNVLVHTQFTGSADKNRAIKVADGPEFVGISKFKPAVAVYEDLLFCFYVHADDAAVCYSTYDGTGWKGPHRIQGRTLSELGAAVRRNKWDDLELTLIFKEINPREFIFLHNSGSEWRSTFRRCSTPSAPRSGIAAAAFEDKFYAAFNDILTDNTYILPPSDDDTQPYTQLAIKLTYSAAGSASICASKGKLYCASAHKSTNACLISSYSDSVWSEPQAIHGLRLKGSPCLAEFKGDLYLLSVDAVGVDIFKSEQ